MANERLERAMEAAKNELHRQSNEGESPYVGVESDWPHAFTLDGRFDMEALVKAILAGS